MNISAGDKLRLIALEAQKHRVKSKGRRIALTKLICAIQQSGQLSREGKDNPSVYSEVLDRTFCAICHQIDEYQETQEVMDWANELLLQNLDAIVETR